MFLHGSLQSVSLKLKKKGPSLTPQSRVLFLFIYIIFSGTESCLLVWTSQWCPLLDLCCDFANLLSCSWPLRPGEFPPALTYSTDSSQFWFPTSWGLEWQESPCWCPAEWKNFAEVFEIHWERLYLDFIFTHTMKANWENNEELQSEWVFFMLTVIILCNKLSYTKVP